MIRPSASVILPTFNKSAYLQRTLASWTQQKSSRYELVILDDGSTDDTTRVVRSFEGRLPVRYMKTENGGRAAARNRALGMARGEIIIFSDDDRVVHPNFVDAHLACFQGDEDVVSLGWQYGLLSEVRPEVTCPPAMIVRLS